MFDAAPHPMLAVRVRTLQIICAALTLGILAFMAVVLLVPALGGDGADTPLTKGIISYVALGYGVISLFLGPMLSTFVTTAGRRKIVKGAALPGRPAAASDSAGDAQTQDDPGKLLQVFMAKTLVSAAIYEGAALFLCVAYLVEHNDLVFIPAVLLAGGIIVQMPSRDRAARWLEVQAQRLEEERQRQQ